MSLVDLLVGRENLRKQRDLTIGAIEEQFDPSILQPQVDFAKERAVEGIGEAGDIAMSQFLEQVFVDQDQSIYGGNQARAIAGGQAETRQKAKALSNLESDLATQDVAARKEGEAMLAQTKARQRQMVGQRESQIGQTEAMFESEMGRRRMGLVSTLLGTAGTLATTPFGGAGTSLAERGLTKLFGDGEDIEEVSGEVDMSNFTDISSMFVDEEGELGVERPKIDISRDLEARDVTQFGDFTLPSDDVIADNVVEEATESVSVGVPEMLARPEQTPQEQETEISEVNLTEESTIDPQNRNIFELMDAVEAGTIRIEDIENETLASAVRNRLGLRRIGRGIRDFFTPAEETKRDPAELRRLFE